MVASQASKATRKAGRKRRSAIAMSSWLPATFAVNQAVKVDESKFRLVSASEVAVAAWVRSVDARARSRRDSVLHFDDA